MIENAEAAVINPVGAREYPHVPQLDSLRGLAAVIVVFGHFLAVFPYQQTNIPLSIRVLSQRSMGELIYDLLHFPPLVWLSSGHSAVVLFFVISGFSLHRMIVSAPRFRFSRYLLRRVGRIYLPYLAALGFAIGLNALIARGPVSGVHPWVNQTWLWPVQLPVVVAHVLFIGKYDYVAFNTAFWSLVQEMRLSIVFPGLLWVSHRLNLKGEVILSAVLLACGTILAGGVKANGGDPEATLLYLGVFSLGVLLSQHADGFKEWYSGCWAIFKVATGLVSLVLFFNAAALLKRVFHVEAGFLAESLSAIGALGVVAIALASQSIGRLLEQRMVAWLGRISYSLYLIHASILFALVRLVVPQHSPVIVLIPYLTLSLVGAQQFYQQVERRCIQLSRRLDAH